MSALYLEVSETVADDLDKKVRDYVNKLEDKQERTQILLDAAREANESYSKMFKILLNDLDVRSVIKMLEENIHKAQTAIVVLQQHGLTALTGTELKEGEKK